LYLQSRGGSKDPTIFTKCSLFPQSKDTDEETQQHYLSCSNDQAKLQWLDCSNKFQDTLREGKMDPVL
jgi:hypothetical protein